MTTAVTQFPRGVRAILLLPARPTQAKPVHRPLSQRKNRTLHCLSTRQPTNLLPTLPDLDVPYRIKRFLAFCFTDAA